MPRQPRIHYEGALYHVICRGNNREWILQTEGEKLRYKELLMRYKKRYGFKLYAWVIMSNHVHLLIEVGSVPLSKIMQGVQQSYTQWYNKTHGRVGHAFEQRYKAKHCNKDSYLLNLTRYIHQNPKRAGIDEGLAYPWCGHQDYLRGDVSALTDIQFPLSLFSVDFNRSRALYCDFMDEEEDLIPTLKQGSLEEGTLEQVAQKVPNDLYLGELQDLIVKASEIFSIPLQELMSKRRSERISRGRHAICLFCSEYTSFTQIEVSKALNTSQTTVALALKNRESGRFLLELLVNNLISKA